MTIKSEASAGTAESGDARVTVRPNPGKGLTLELHGPSVVRYGEGIKAAAAATLGELGITDAMVSIDEKGALDATIRARLAAACVRAGDGTAVPWEAMA